MAVAGRVAIRPSGAFDIETSYERLDMVKYQNTLFVAKKAASGVVPAEGEFWMDCGGTDLSDIEKKIRALEAPEFTEAEELEGLESKKPNGTLWGRVAKAVSSLIAHLGNKENPHKVTAAQTGALTKDNILNSTVATEAGQAAADAVQLNKEVEGSYAAGVAAEISEINADLSTMYETVTFFGDLSFFDDVIIWGHGCAVKNTISKTLDLHIQAKVMNDATNNNDGHGFIDMDKVTSMIGVNTIFFASAQSMVNIANQEGGNLVDTIGRSGYTGLLFTRLGRLARFYTEDGSIGEWELNMIQQALQQGLVYNINVYGASYS